MRNENKTDRFKSNPKGKQWMGTCNFNHLFDSKARKMSYIFQANPYNRRVWPWYIVSRGGWEIDLLHRLYEDSQVRSTASIDVCLKPGSLFLHVKSEFLIIWPDITQWIHKWTSYSRHLQQIHISVSISTVLTGMLYSVHDFSADCQLGPEVPGFPFSDQMFQGEET